MTKDNEIIFNKTFKLQKKFNKKFKIGDWIKVETIYGLEKLKIMAEAFMFDINKSLVRVRRKHSKFGFHINIVKQQQLIKELI